MTALAPTHAESLVHALAARDFEGMAASLSDDVELQALLPRGFVTWNGPTAVAGAFATWFGARDQFEVQAATVGTIGLRLHLRWRIRCGDLLVEQQVYADPDAQGRLHRLVLLCSGFCEEPA